MNDEERITLFASTLWICLWSIAGFFAPTVTLWEGLRVAGLTLLCVVILLFCFGGNYD